MKKRKDQLKEKSSTIFLMGLTCAMAFSLVSFEWKNFEPRDISFATYEDDDFPDEDIIHVIPPKPKVKKRKVAVKIKNSLVKLIVDNETEILDKKEPIILDPLKDIHIIFEEDSVEEDGPMVNMPYVITDQRAEFPGGVLEMYRFLGKMEYPPAAVDAGISGQVYLKFIVRKDGRIDDIKVERGIGGGCDEVAIKTLKNSPRWKPGFVKGVAVDSYFNLPVEFTLE